MSTAVSGPNILFLVWDACRVDHAQERADTLRDLAAENVNFENAVAASNWSLPSHASLFSGAYPSEHGSHMIHDSIDATPLLDSLHDADYRSYSVSANGFASHRTGFHEPFDETHYTNGAEVFQDGLGVYDYGRSLSADGARMGFELFRAALEHDRPLRSVCNLGSVAVAKAATKVDALQRVPHPLFAGQAGYTYTGARNNHHIERILKREAQTESPFFLFSNFMDTHRPYLISDDEETSYREFHRVNEEVGSLWRFLEKRASGEPVEEDLDRLREFYANEVGAVDEYLDELLSILDSFGLRENTLVVVTADHGENLGEEDDTGRVRVGHEASMSDDLVRVPLVVAHPDLDAKTISDPVSLNGLFDLFEHADAVVSGTEDIESLFPTDAPVFCESPANGATQLYENFPDVPESISRERAEEHGIVGYFEDWRVLIYSTGESHAFRDGEPAALSDAPEELAEGCKRHLARLQDGDAANVSLSADEVERLEALGYL